MAVGEFDVVSGLAGVGACLLRQRAVSLEPILAAFVRVTRSGDPARAWHTSRALLEESERAMFPDGYVNCGLAHGIPGPLALLALAEREGVRVDGARGAIERLAGWLADQRIDDEWGGSWPSVVSLTAGEEPGRARAAWCYGTVGVARALWLAGEALDDSSYRDLAVAGMEAVYRLPISERRIDSPTFCHGVAGLLQVTLRFAHDTGLSSFREAAATTVEQLLDLYDPDSLLGYRDLEPGGRTIDRAALVDGAAGIALVLLAASSSAEPAWDRAFLLS
jgi:hypothetical protein